MPFGLHIEEWDAAAWTADELGCIIDQVASFNSADSRVWVSVIPPEKYGEYKQVFEDHGWTNVHLFIWNKPKLNATGVDCYIFRNEILMIAYYPKKGKAAWFTDPNPTLRGNDVGLAVVSSKLQSPEGKTINQHEKPPELISFFIHNHLRPGDWCLVVGAGAGGDVQGCIDMNVNVVGIEKDKVQWGACINRFTAHRDDLEEKSKIEDPVDEEIEKDDEKEEDQPSQSDASKKRRKEARVQDEDGEEESIAKKPKAYAACQICGLADEGSSEGECQQCGVKVHEACLKGIENFTLDLLICSDECAQLLVQSGTPK
jgi:hypothetical protein